MFQFDFLSRHLPANLTLKSAMDSIASAQAELLYGRTVDNERDLQRLRTTRFDLELATATELRTVPSGWLDHHQVLLPDGFAPEGEDAIRTRLKRMVHTPANDTAIAAILSQVVIPRKNAKGKIEYFNPILSLEILARDLAHARVKDRRFVDDLLRGYLGDCAQALADGKINMPTSSARDMLINLSALWGLHDLQVIACRLFQATVWPTGGWLEGQDFKPQTMARLDQLASKTRLHLKTIEKSLKRQHPLYDGPRHDPQYEKEMRSLIGFATGNGLKNIAVSLAHRSGFSESEIHNKNVPLREGQRRHFLATTQYGLSHVESIGKILGDKHVDRDGKARSSTHLHAGSFRDGMRSETALSYAIISFVHMVIELPDRVDRFVDNRDVTALERATLVAHNFSHIRVFIQGLIAAYRAIFLLDANQFAKGDEKTGPDFFKVARQQSWDRQEVREALIAQASSRLLTNLKPAKTARENKADASRPGRDMITDARRILDQESGLPLDYQNKQFEPVGLDPALSPALAWRFSCRRDHVPTPSFARPFAPKF